MPSWETFEGDLTTTLRGLLDGGFAIVEATLPPGREVVVRPRRLFGLVPEKRAIRQPYVQVMRLQEHLSVECIGSPRTDGSYPMTDAEHDQLLDLGWTVPWREDFFVPNYQREWLAEEGVPYSRSTHTADSAALAVRTLRDVFGCPGPEATHMETGETRAATR